MTTHPEEKSLTEIWAKALPRLRRNRLNAILRWSGPVLGALVYVLFDRPPDFIKVINQLSGTLAGVWGSLLGFVIAGYAIFTAAIDPAFMLSLWRLEESHSKFPHLKVRLLVFTQLFIYLFLGLVIFVALHLATSILPHVLAQLPIRPKLALGVLGMTSLGFAVSSCLVEMKALIFNLYDLAITQAKKLDIDARGKGARS